MRARSILILKLERERVKESVFDLNGFWELRNSSALLTKVLGTLGPNIIEETQRTERASQGTQEPL